VKSIELDTYPNAIYTLARAKHNTDLIKTLGGREEERKRGREGGREGGRGLVLQNMMTRLAASGRMQLLDPQSPVTSDSAST
jgi:hypothetical protein